MTATSWLAALTFGLALEWLWPAPRLWRLRARAAPGDLDPARPGPLLARLGRVRWGLVLLLAVAGWLLADTPVTGMLTGAGFAIGGSWLIGRLESEPERRRNESLVRQLPGCLDLLASAMDAGVPLRAATRQVAALAPQPSASLLHEVLGHLEIGRTDAQSWTTLRSHPVWGPVARDMARCAESGTAVAQVLDGHAAEARSRRHAQRESRARTAGVRSVLPLVCCFLPAFVLVGVVPIVAATVTSFLNG